MSETTIVALSVTSGVFLLMFVTLVKYNVDAAIKMWGLLGVLLAAITSHYFTNQANKTQIAGLQDSNKAVKLALSKAVEKARYANNIITNFTKGTDGINWVVKIPNNERDKLIKKFSNASIKLQEIGKLENTTRDN
jgi:hypothetical protein